MKDLTEIVPLLHSLRRPTFFTHDLGFFDPLLCHKGYSLVCLDTKANESAIYIRRILRHRVCRETTTWESLLVRQRNLSFWEIGEQRLQRSSLPQD